MKKSLRKSQQGFTLVELLVVVVILGILAVMIVPRMLAQTNRAATAEAVNMLGTIRRSAINFADTTGAGTWPAFGFAGGAASGSWTDLGLGSLPATSKYSYATPGGAFNAGVVVTATKLGNPVIGGTITIDLDTGALGCATGFANTTDGSGNVVGCQ